MIHDPEQTWPTVHSLPKRERELFRRWLEGQSRPMNQDKHSGVVDFDCYFPWDYERWKLGRRQ